MSDEFIHERKLDHVRLAAEKKPEDAARPFAGIALRHRALPEIDLQDVDPSIEIFGRRLSFPLLIAPLTGGDHELLTRINTSLAEAAGREGIGLCLGSQRIMFSRPEARSSFQVRRLAPETLICANLGAVQLNYGFTIEHCRAAVETVAADALCLHVNPLQEALQPEGNTRFAGLADRIGEVAAQLETPLIVKEVGSGLDPQDARLLLNRGVNWFDVAGGGGTCWAAIEGARRNDGCRGLSRAFAGWGRTTPESLRALSGMDRRVRLIASGGIRSGVDMAKAMIMGASLCAIAAPFLEPAMESAEAVAAMIRRLREEFRLTLFLLGVRRAERLSGNRGLLADSSRERPESG